MPDLETVWPGGKKSKRVVFRVDNMLPSDHCPRTIEFPKTTQVSFCTLECLEEHRGKYAGPMTEKS